MRVEMWPEVELSASAGGRRVSQYAFVVGWATAKWIVQAQVLSQQDDQRAQSRLVSSRWKNWIRAWDSGEPATSHSAARTVECAALPRSRVSWTSQVGRSLHPGISRLRGLQDRDEFATSGAGSDGSFKAENAAFLLV